MPQRQNLKPTVQDTLRRLRQDTLNGATVAHGVKAVQPGEGLQLISTTGTETFWDGDTAEQWSQAIADGTAAIADAAGRLGQAEQDLTDAKDRIGRVAAGEIEKIDGRIILNGTVDAPKINVTGELAATIVQSMSSETKKLVVTEDAILNRATVVEGLVTAELISEKANIGDLASRMITSGLMQTDPAANRGVKVDNNGIRAWDDAGRQTVNLNGKANYITGTFATAEKEQRVEIKSGGSVASADFFGSGNTVDHLGVWHQADAGNATASRIISQHEIKRSLDNPGIALFPFRGDFAFTGRWARNTQSVKCFSLVNYSGLPGGGYVDLTYKYTTPFSTTYVERFPIMGTEARNGAEIVATVRSQTETEITIRLVNKSTNPSGVLYLRGMTLAFNTIEYTDSY